MGLSDGNTKQKMTNRGWREVRLGDVVDVNPLEKLPKGITAKKVNMNVLIPFTRKIPEYVTEIYKGGSRFRNGDTLLARITPCLENGKTAFVDFLNCDEIGFGSTEFIVMREKIGSTDKQFIYYFAMSEKFRNTAIQSMTGTSGRQRVETAEVLNYKFLLPPLPEQKAIAEVLSSLDDKIDLLHWQNRTLEDMAQTLFRKWFIEDADEGWEEKPLDDIANYLNGLACQKYPPISETDKLPVLKIKELRSGISENSDWTTSEISPQYIVTRGDIIFSWSGSLMIKLWDGEKCVLNQHLFKVTSTEYPHWYVYLWTKHHIDKFIQIAESKATTMGHIKRADLSNSMALVPRNDEIATMDRQISPLFDKIMLNYRQVQTLENLRDMLLPKLMSGKVKVNNG